MENIRKDKAKEIKELIDIMTVLSEKQANIFSSDFLILLQLVFRLCISCYRGIYKLTEDERLGDSALTLTRKILEAVITIEWMVAKGKEEKTQQFKRYVKVQNYKISQYKQQFHIPDLEREDNIKAFENVKDEFTKDKKTGELWRSWSKGIAIEDMLRMIRKKVNLLSKPYNKKAIDKLAEMYVSFCWKNHVNPYDTLKYYKKDELIQTSRNEANEALNSGFFLMYNLTIRYRDELEQTDKKIDLKEIDERLIEVKKNYYNAIF